MVWLTDTNGRYERDPVLARLGSQLPEQYLVGWMMENDRTFHIGIINGAGTFLEGPETMSSSGPGWGSRDDSFTSAPDGSVAWLEGNAYATTLELHQYAVLTVFGDGFETGSTTGWSSTTN